jgi:hypothetical protein
MWCGHGASIYLGDSLCWHTVVEERRELGDGARRRRRCGSARGCAGLGVLCSALLLAPVIEASIGGTVTGAPCSPPLPPLPPSGSNVTGLGTSTQPRCTRVRWSTHRLPARSIWFRPMEHTPCSYSSILVEFISRYFKYSLYVF